MPPVMAPLALLRYPDPRLKHPASPVGMFDDALGYLIDQLFDQLRTIPAIGLTACHVGVAQRVVVMNVPDGHGPLALVNPVITATDANTATFSEGSVCMPGILEPVTRPQSVGVTYQDRFGAQQTAHFTQFESATIQHEIDQLDGVFFIERLSRLRRDRVLSRWQKVIRGA